MKIGTGDFKDAKSTTFSHNESVFAIDKKIINKLKEAALNHPLKCSRFCLHKNHKNPVQEMVIAISNKFYIRAHKQVGKEKTYMLIEGKLLVTFFDDSGNIKQKIKLGNWSEDEASICRFDSSIWHTVIALSDIAVYVEITSGPFEKEKTEWADWSPCQREFI